jgi:hypothetical protein
MGVEVRQNDIVVFGPLGANHVPWNEVAGLGTHRWSINTIVDVKLVDGRTLNTNLIQGAPVVWNGGKTVDILSVLQAELSGRSA